MPVTFGLIAVPAPDFTWRERTVVVAMTTLMAIYSWRSRVKPFIGIHGNQLVVCNPSGTELIDITEVSKILPGRVLDLVLVDGRTIHVYAVFAHPRSLALGKKSYVDRVAEELRSVIGTSSLTIHSLSIGPRPASTRRTGVLILAAFLALNLLWILFQK